MTKLAEILGHYEDFELAFLVKFKYDSYLDDSKKVIDKELNRRGLTADKIESLIDRTAVNAKTINDGLLHCPRCTSKKISKDQVEYWNTYSRIGINDEIATYDGIIGKQTYKDKLTCMVCDYVLNDPNSGGILNFQDKVSNIFRWIKKINNR